MYKRIRCGDVVDRVQTYVGRRTPERGKRIRESSEAKKECNLRQSVRELTRLLNCNLGHDWIMIVLTYEEPPADDKTAEKNCVNWWRRLSYALGAELPPVGVWITADKDSRTGQPVRLHHHVLLDPAGIAVKEKGDHLEAYVGDRSMEDIWGKGFVKIRRVEKEKTYAALADYLVRQSISGRNTKKWHASHGLERPIVEAVEYSDTRFDLRPPVGAEVLERSEFNPDSVTEFLSTWEPRKGKASRSAKPRRRKKPKLTPEQKRRRGYYSKRRE